MRWFAAFIVLTAIFFSVGWYIGAARRAGVAEVANCGLDLAGSNTIGERLAPALGRAFFEAEGYTVTEAEAAEDETILLIARDQERCALNVRSHGSALSFEELIAGTTVIGMSSRVIRAGEIEALATAGAGDFTADANLAEHVIALDGIAIIVHTSNPLRMLTRTDVRRAFVGEVIDWSAFGGAQRPIARYARDDQSGTFQFFEENVLQDDPNWARTEETTRRFASSSELVAAVAADPGAIGFVGMAYLTPEVRALAISDGGPAFDPTPTNVRSEIYPITRRLFLYTRPQTTRENARAAALINFFKSEAAYPIVEELGYVSLAPSARTTFAAAETQLACEPGAAETQVYRIATANAERLPVVIRFLPGSNESDSLARDDIGRVGALVEAALREARVVRLIGHSDAQGDASANRRLALQRADAIRAAFEEQEIFGLQVESAGEMCPVSNNESDQGRQSNRRVEIWIGARAG